MNQVTKREPQAVVSPLPNQAETPRYTVRETGEAFVLTAWLPGVDRSTLETTVDGETLTVFGRRSFTAPEDWTTVLREIPQTDFRLVLEVDNRVNREAVRAELSQGVLTLTLPKAEAIKPRRIEIQG